MKTQNLLMALLAVFFLSCNSNAQEKKNSSKTFPVSKTEAEWKNILEPQEYTVLRKAGTERPFSSELNKIKEPGTFVCAACGNELFKTEHKFESGTGWPSFDRPIKGAVGKGTDNSLGFTRDEIYCADCGGHLGHVFNDGPRETTGLRYCMNGVAMEFVPAQKTK